MLTFISGWGKKMSYVIAFSIDGAYDVSRRYVRNVAAHGQPRNRCPEEVLLYITNEIKQMRRSNMAKDEKHRLIKEEQREERELRSYVVGSLAAEIEKLIPEAKRRAAAAAQHQGSASVVASVEEPKLPARQTGTEAWRRARRENGPADERPREGQ
jgi:peptide-N4-(N-acetyl-beta-glucosaminyl)asparagine amidase